MATDLAPPPAIDLPREAIAAFCRRWQIVELALFGSVLRDDFGPESDVGLMVTFAPEAPWSLFELVDMKHELEDLIGREVDLIERAAIEASHNWFRRRAILGTTQTIHGPG